VSALVRLARSRADLDAAVARCRRMVTRRALASAGVALVPAPGIDVAADVALLTELIPAINREFGLTPDQIDELNPRMKGLVYKAIVTFGAAMVGRLITRELIVQALLKVGVRVTAKTAARLVPIAGQAVAAGLSYGAMRLVGESHIRDCRRVVEALAVEAGEAPSPPPPPRPSAAQRLKSAAATAASRLSRKPPA
jgi:uncharacterized protein (DUF697 family)